MLDALKSSSKNDRKPFPPYVCLLSTVEHKQIGITKTLNRPTVIEHKLSMLAKGMDGKMFTLICHINTANVILLSPVKCRPAQGHKEPKPRGSLI